MHCDGFAGALRQPADPCEGGQGRGLRCTQLRAGAGEAVDGMQRLPQRPVVVVREWVGTGAGQGCGGTRVRRRNIDWGQAVGPAGGWGVVVRGGVGGGGAEERDCAAELCNETVVELEAGGAHRDSGVEGGVPQHCKLQHGLLHVGCGMGVQRDCQARAGGAGAGLAEGHLQSKARGLGLRLVDGRQFLESHVARGRGGVIKRDQQQCFVGVCDGGDYCHSL